MVVEGWRETTLADVAKINAQSLPSSTPKDYKLRYLDIASISKTEKVSDISEIEYAVAPSRAKRIVRNGDIVVSTVRPYLRAFAHIKVAPNNLIASTGYAVITATKDAEASFLYQVILSEEFLSYLTKRMKGSNYPAVTADDVAMAPIRLPPMSEQKKIAEVLGSVDEAIVKTEAVIAQAQHLKQGLLKTLLTKGIGHTKFKKTEIGELPASWEVKRISDVMKMLHNPVKVSPSTLYQEIGIRSHGKGIFVKPPIKGTELGNKRVFWIQPNCLIVNIVFAWERAIAYTTEQENGKIASHRFPMYYPIKEKIDVVFLTKYFLSKIGNFYIKGASPGGAGRNKTLGQKSFQKIPIPIPPIKEQKIIADTILKFEEMEASQISDLNKLLEIKKGLMSDLLNGRVRVKLDKKREKAA